MACQLLTGRSWELESAYLGMGPHCFSDVYLAAWTEVLHSSETKAARISLSDIPSSLIVSLSQLFVHPGMKPFIRPWLRLGDGNTVSSDRCFSADSIGHCPIEVQRVKTLQFLIRLVMPQKPDLVWISRQQCQLLTIEILFVHEKYLRIVLLRSIASVFTRRCAR